MATPKKNAAKKTAAKKTTKPRKRATTRRKAPAASKAKKAPEVIEKTAVPVPEGYFIRNLAGAPFSVRLERQQETRRRTELKPRGQRGDLAKLKEEDLSDPAITENVQLGLIEIITAAEAVLVAGKQTENQQAVHPALSILTNPKGEPYEGDPVVMEEPFEKQGVVVAQTDGEGNVVVGRGGIQRAPREGIIDDGFASKQENVPGGVRVPASELSAAQRDQIARDAKKRGIKGPEAGLGGLAVKVSPTQKS